MPNSYSLTVINNSELDRPTFAVFATLPASSAYDTLSLAWLTQPINAQNQYVFTWDIAWGFAWSAQGTGAGYQWTGSGKLPANPNAADQCKAQLSYNQDFELTPVNGNPDGQTLWVTDAPTVPLPSDQASSVAITLDGNSVCATNAGPNLSQTFTLHPTYYIDAGNYVQGQMVDGSSVSNFQELAYTGGNTALTVTLNPDNTWDTKSSKQLDYRQVFAAREVRGR
ncbi:hypothetical protein G1H11_20130 [Phytoactinopolyspora alkaliphila]|uniref:Protein rhiA n=1 Tax=Phytoactinopolyspora alkaliphila TaxID=1783498 RepID=A0A6N9YRC5_9ACTN|nr:hypothetical protein [Phytoactinopolyspora alkaliphila]NED97611.1 hypothetical protein [Phytoactinopolyspora alkaliphila]